MESNFPRIIDFVLAREAGYVNHPKDPGGATNLGITIATLGAWRRHPVSEMDVRRLGRAEAVKIYHRNYWNAARCAELPAGIDLLVMDATVLSGTEPALNFVRGPLGLPLRRRNSKGVFAKTLEPERTLQHQRLLLRMEGACMPGLIAGVSQRRRDFYRSLPTFGTFGRGWLSRVEMAQDLAMHLWATQPRAADEASAP